MGITFRDNSLCLVTFYLHGKWYERVFLDASLYLFALQSQVVSQLPDSRFIFSRLVECLIVFAVYLCAAKDNNLIILISKTQRTRKTS